MFTFGSARRAVWLLAALLILTTGLLAHDVASAADLATAPDAKKSDSAGTLKIKPDKHDFGKVIVPLTSAPETITVTNNSKSASVEFTLNTAEIFDPVMNTFTLTTDASLGGNNMNVARKLHTASAY